MPRPCESDHAFGPQTCRLCWLYQHDGAYRALWGGAPPGPSAAAAPARRSLPCVHLGEVIDRLGCPCPGRWLRRCGLHAATTIEQCKTCADYQDDE